MDATVVIPSVSPCEKLTQPVRALAEAGLHALAGRLPRCFSPAFKSSRTGCSESACKRPGRGRGQNARNG